MRLSDASDKLEDLLLQNVGVISGQEMDACRSSWKQLLNFDHPGPQYVVLFAATVNLCLGIQFELDRILSKVMPEISPMLADRTEPELALDLAHAIEYLMRLTEFLGSEQVQGSALWQGITETCVAMSMELNRRRRNMLPTNNGERLYLFAYSANRIAGCHGLFHVPAIRVVE